MAEAFVELGAEAVNHVTEHYHDQIYDTVNGKIRKVRGKNDKYPSNQNSPTQQNYNQQDQDYPPGQQQQDYSPQDRNENAPPSATSSRRRHYYNSLPTPDGEQPPNWDSRSYTSKSNNRYRRRESQRSASLDRESEVSEKVIRAYENERDDPSRAAETVLSKKELRKLHPRDRDRAVAAGAAAGMSYANGGYGGGGSNLQAGGYDRRANSQQPPRTRGYDDDDSDYDERTGRRYRASGRGYDDYDDDKGYDREIIETERYRGPARGYDSRRESYGNRNDPYAAGAVTQYRRQDVDRREDDYKSQRSRSRGRRNSEKRDRSYSDSRSRSRSRSNGGIKGKLDDTFDTSMKGIGIGIAGAVVGGLAGKELGGKQHRNRDMIIGALVGGLGANAAENKWREWKDEKEQKLHRDENRWEERWDGGRSRSAMR